MDSRAVTKDGLFVGLKGERTDGHLYSTRRLRRARWGHRRSARRWRACKRGLFVWPDGRQLVKRGRTGGPGDERGLPVVFVAREQPDRPPAAGDGLALRLPVVIVGITGSVGKSTTKETVANVLATRYVTLRSEGN